MLKFRASFAAELIVERDGRKVRGLVGRRSQSRVARRLVVEIVKPIVKAILEDIIPLAGARRKKAKIATKELTTNEGHGRPKHNNAAGCCVTLVEEFMAID